jgi:hypothetical protein
MIGINIIVMQQTIDLISSVCVGSLFFYADLIAECENYTNAEDTVNYQRAENNGRLGCGKGAGPLVLPNERNEQNETGNQEHGAQ